MVPETARDVDARPPGEIPACPRRPPCHDRVMLVSRDDLEASLAQVRALVADPRHGIHGPHSPAWRLDRDVFNFLGGGRAALLQLAHPFVAYAIDQHSSARSDVVGRFQRTFASVFAISFGALDDAFRAARRVHEIHARITGALPEAVGPFPAGTVYHANDVDALLWVHATLVDTVVQVTELIHGRLRAGEKDAYCRASWQFARMFGIPEARLPSDWPAFRRYFDGMVESPVITVAPPARDMARFLLGRGPGQRQGHAAWLVEVITAGLLPPRLRVAFDLRFGPRERLAWAAILTGLRSLARRMPPRLRYLPAYLAAQRRLQGEPPSETAAWFERHLFGLASVITGSARSPGGKDTGGDARAV
jgi:uncharacterized protein (DUF2236 family)